MLLLKLLPTIVGFTTLIWAFIIIFKGDKSKPQLLFSLLCLSISIWSIGYSLVYLSTTTDQALFWVRFAFIGVIFIPVFNFDFIINYIQIKNKLTSSIIKFLYLFTFVYLLISRFDIFLHSPKLYWWGYYPTAGFLYIFFVIMFMLSFITIAIITFPTKTKKNRLKTNEYNQYKLLFFSYSTTILAGVDYLPNYGISIYPFAYILTFIWISLLAYAIMRHKFLDIEIIITKATYFIILFTSIIVPIILLNHFLTNLIPKNLGIFKLLTSAIIWTICFLFADYIKIFLKNITDKILFMSDYNYDELVAEMSQKMNEITDTISLFDFLRRKISQNLKTEKIYLFIYNSCNCKYHLHNITELDHFFDMVGKKKIQEYKNIKVDQDVLDILKSSPNLLLDYNKIKQQYTIDKDKKLKKSLDFMDELDSTLLIGTSIMGKITGILAVAKKINGAKFKKIDLNILFFILNQTILTLSKIEEIAEKATFRVEKEIESKHRIELENKNNLLADTNKKLNDVVIELKDTQKKLIEEEQLSAMGKLSGEVAHDIRNPLSSMNRLLSYLLKENGVLENNEIILLETNNKLEETKFDEKEKLLEYIRFILSNNNDIKETLQEIQKNNSRLRRIANDFLEYSKVSKDIVTEPICIKNIIEEQINLIKAEINDRDIDLILNLESDKKTCFFDRQILKIFENIIDNAVKAIIERTLDGSMDNGKKQIAISLKDAEYNNNIMLELSISDTGIGIPQENLHEIFKPFFTKRKNLQGTGLGLAIIKKIIDNCNGYIEVDSEVGKGTCFRIYFPIRDCCEMN